MADRFSSDYDTNVRGSRTRDIDFAPMTIEDEGEAKGWNRTNKPVGEGEPYPCLTSGNAGQQNKEAELYLDEREEST